MSSFSELKNILREWPNQALPEKCYSGHPHERLRKALLDIENTKPADLAILIRHLLRFESGRSGDQKRIQVPFDTESWPTRDAWKKYGCSTRDYSSPSSSQLPRIEIVAEEWKPQWPKSPPLLDHKNREEACTSPFSATETETPRHPRAKKRNPKDIPCDPALAEKVDGVASYLSNAQAETVRSAVLAPPGSVRLVILPTGSGKSLVGLAAAMVGKSTTGLSIFVVPTVALAIDQVTLAKRFFPDSKDSISAWQSSLGDADKLAILDKIDNGSQRLLFTSPESLIGPLKRRVLSTAQRQGLRAVVIDEAHLVGQWGSDFRPAFQTLSALWQRLRELCPSMRTVMMTATVTTNTFQDLRHFYDPEDTMETLAAVTLREEPDYFLSKCNTDLEKEERILEALRHGPRPAILYVTKVKDAEKWYERCRQEGWNRVGSMHGKTSPKDREDVIREWQTDKIDLMVATSAFGLGMDKGDVRLILHACVPETIDRYYQEVGRGGRDGYACASMMIWKEDDLQLAKRMGSRTLIGDQKGFRRWQAMWNARENSEDQCFVNLQKKWNTEHWAGDSNLIWNIRTLLLMSRIGVIELLHFDPPDLQRLPDESEEEYERRREELIASDKVRFAIRILGNAPTSQEEWNELTHNYRQQVKKATKSACARLNSLVKYDCSLNSLLKDAYTVKEAGISFVSETAEDIPPHPLSFPELKVTTALQKWLKDSGALPRKHQTPVAFITYQSDNIDGKIMAYNWIRILKSLISAGIREVALPKAWRDAKDWGGGRKNPINKDLTQKSAEGFLVIRNLEDDHDWSRHPLVPRVSFLPPDYSNNPVPRLLLRIHRPLHLILLPETCYDPGDPRNKISFRNAAISLSALEQRL